MNRHIEGFDPRVIDLFKSYSWPGNVRELENTVEGLVHAESICKGEPQLIEAMRLIILKGSGFSDLWPQFWATVGFAVLFNGLALVTFRKTAD